MAGLLVGHLGKKMFSDKIKHSFIINFQLFSWYRRASDLHPFLFWEKKV